MDNLEKKLTCNCEEKEESDNSFWILAIVFLLFFGSNVTGNSKVDFLEKEIAELKGKISILERLV